MSRLLRNVKFQVTLAEVAKEAWQSREMDDSIVINAWLGISQANLMHYFTPDGEVDFELLHDLPIPIQQNLKKIKITEATTHFEDGERTEKTTEVQVVDRVAVLRDIARWRGFFTEVEASDANKVADAIARGQARIRRQAMTFDNDPVEAG